MNVSQDVAIITSDMEKEGHIEEGHIIVDDNIVSSEEGFEEEEDQDQYIKASRYSFEIKDEHFIFDFKDVDPEEENVEEEENDDAEENDDDDEDDDEDNDKDGMETEVTPDVEMTEQQRIQAEKEAKEAVQKNITRRMGWFDMIRRLEKKVVNEKRMAQSGGYDLNDPFIDDNSLTKQTTSTNIPEPPPFQVIRYNALDADEGKDTIEDSHPVESNKRKKGEKMQLTDKQKQQLAAWTPSPRVKQLLDELRVKAGEKMLGNSIPVQMPIDLDDLLSELDEAAMDGSNNRPAPLVLALIEIFPFHPQTIKLRLRLLKRRRECSEMERRYAKEKMSFLSFVYDIMLNDTQMRQWAHANGNKPQWTIETQLKMAQIYQLLEERVEKNNLLAKSERCDEVLDMDTEFIKLSNQVQSFFAGSGLTLVDVQVEFEKSVKDEDLKVLLAEEKGENTHTNHKKSRPVEADDDADEAVITPVFDVVSDKKEMEEVTSIRDDDTGVVLVSQENTINADKEKTPMKSPEKKSRKRSHSILSSQPDGGESYYCK